MRPKTNYWNFQSLKNLTQNCLNWTIQNSKTNSASYCSKIETKRKKNSKKNSTMIVTNSTKTIRKTNCWIANWSWKNWN